MKFSSWMKFYRARLRKKCSIFIAWQVFNIIIQKSINNNCFCSFNGSRSKFAPSVGVACIIFKYNTRNRNSIARRSMVPLYTWVIHFSIYSNHAIVTERETFKGGIARFISVEKHSSQMDDPAGYACIFLSPTNRCEAYVYRISWRRQTVFRVKVSPFCCHKIEEIINRLLYS